MDIADQHPAERLTRRQRREDRKVHRRPTGTPPPLPRELGKSGRFWLSMTALFVLILIIVAITGSAAMRITQLDTWILEGFARARTALLTDIMEAYSTLGTRLSVRILRWGIIIALIVFRRWRHLVVFVGSVIALETIVAFISLLFYRPRPFNVEILVGWSGPSLPSRTIASLAVTLIGIAYTLIVPGKLRETAKWAIGIVLSLYAVALLFLAANNPSDILFGAILGIGVGVMAFRMFTPNEVFPVMYGKGKAAHLDVGGRRGEAIKQAIHEQLGLRVTALKPVGLEASGGSSPVRLTVVDDEGERHLFAKVFAKTHVRSDRWYKLGRTILYGGLEDESSFKTVRRIVEYEDHMLRLMRDAGIRIAKPYGIVEITPEAEYMLITEFFDGAEEIGKSEIDEGIIDQGLDLVLKMWDAGLAHRDLKPANLMVRDGELLLIDTGFAQVRPSPWRQAIDLANMMLVLGLRSDAQTVHERALEVFTPDEVAEAFAATHGIASPSQLRTELKGDQRDLVDEFRSLAPTRRRIPIQVWSFKRVLVTIGAVLLSLFAFALVAGNARIL
jgi:tRNA A-37 threonylcarbamoyl transferase component Bud32/membrane-associated phospholipid phosphatase